MAEDDANHLHAVPTLREAPSLAADLVAGTIDILAGETGAEAEGDSDIFVVVRRSSPDLSAEALAAAAASESVTLFVYGWESVEPGLLSWAFPNLQAALLAVRTMRNAVEWCIASGREPSIDVARAKGTILIEQNA